MMDLEADLRAALRADPVASLDVGATHAGVVRKRRARTRRRTLAGIAATAAVVLTVLALRPSPKAHAPRPMFAINLVSAAHAAGLPPDEALMRQAWAAYQAGERARTQALLQRILDEHPSSPWADDAAVGRGEDRFDEGDLTGALALFA